MKTRFSILAICASAVIAAVSYLSAADGIVVGGGNALDPTTHAPTSLDASDNGTTNADSSMNKRLLIGTKSVQVTPTLAVSTSPAYAQFDVVGGKLTFSSAMRVSGGNGRLQSLMLLENSVPAQKAPMQLILFDTPSLTGTYTDNAVFTLNAADVSHVIRSVPIATADYVTVSGTTIATVDLNESERVLVASGTTSLGGVLVLTATNTPTYSATNSLILRLGIRQD